MPRHKPLPTGLNFEPARCISDRIELCLRYLIDKIRTEVRWVKINEIQENAIYEKYKELRGLIAASGPIAINPRAISAIIVWDVMRLNEERYLRPSQEDLCGLLNMTTATFRHIYKQMKRRGMLD